MSVSFRRLSWILAVSLLVLAPVNFSLAQAAASQEQAPKYIFLFIGDGMGPVQRKTANIVARQLAGKDLLMETLPSRGAIQTRSADNAVTDSAAAATALASGIKTNNGMLGVTPEGKAVESICSRLAKAKNMKVGLITSVELNHATPAGFYAHVDKRASYDAVAQQVPAANLDLLIGNGLLSDTKSQDKIMASWKQAGLTVTTNLKDAAAADKAAHVVAVLKYPNAKDERKSANGMPGQLAKSVELAISRLDNPNGFFLMTEGGKIDKGGHSNSALDNIEESLAFDRAIQVAYEFYKKNPTQTLIIVTADHETGGMQLDESRLNFDRLAQVDTQRAAFSKSLAKEGLTREVVIKTMAQTYQINDLSEAESAAIDKALAAKEPRKQRNAVLLAVGRIAQSRAGVTWARTGHTNVDVPLTAVGAGASCLEGTYDNTLVSRKILALLGCEKAFNELPSAAPQPAGAPSRELEPVGAGVND